MSQSDVVGERAFPFRKLESVILNSNEFLLSYQFWEDAYSFCSASVIEQREASYHLG